MRPDRVVVGSPLLDDHLCFSERVEDLSVEQLIAQLAVERFAVAVLPRTPRSDVNSLRAEPCQPLLDYCVSNGLPCFDVSDAFLAEDRGVETAEWFMSHGHYSPAGNRVVASWIGDKLREVVR